MFFVASKIAWFFLDIANVLMIGLIAAMAMHVLGRTKGALRLYTLTAALALTLTTLPFGDVFLRTLEERFPAMSHIAMPAHVDGIIVLGGAIDPVMSRTRDQVALGSAAERLTAFAALSRKYPNAKRLFTGGSGSVIHQDDKEAPHAERLLKKFGISDVVYESQSRNTHENAMLSKALMSPKADETWLLVTSAVHMPRAIGVFRAQGWPVTAYPVDYALRPDSLWSVRFSLSTGIGRLNAGLHEWIGLIAYRLTERTNEFFPSP